MSSASRPLRLNQAAWLLGAILFFGSAYFYQDPEWNGNSRLNLTRAIVEQGTFRIDDYHDTRGWQTGDKAYFEGHYYSDKAIGTSFMAVPVYFVLYCAARFAGWQLSPEVVKHVLTTIVMGGSFVLAGLSMWSIALRISGDAWRAAWTTLLIAFGTMLWPYSAVFYGHLPAAAFLVAAFASLFAVDQASPGVDSAAWAWIGVAVSLAFLSDHTTAVVLVGLAAYAYHAVRRLSWREKIRSAWPAIPGLFIPLLFFVAYNLTVYGRPVAFGYTYEVEERFQGIMGLGVMGIRLPTLGASYHITLDPKFGLLWLSPLLALALVGYYTSFKQRRVRAETLLSIYAIAAIFYVNAASFLWYGGSTFGPRLLIPALPFFIVPLALLPAAWTPALIVLGLPSVANMLIPLLGQIQFTKLEFKPGKGGFFVADMPFRGFSLLYGYGLEQVRALARAGSSPWTLGAAVGLPLWLSVLALGAVQAFLLARLRSVLSRTEAAE